MSSALRRLTPLAAMALAGCFPTLYPGPSADYDLAFARSWSAERQAGDATPVERLSLEQLYAVHRFGLARVHPSRGRADEFARRGAAAVPFLRAKLEGERSWGQVGSILEAFKAMQDAGTYDVRRDPSLVALIQRAAGRYGDDPHATVRNLADELETGTRIPTWFQPYYRAPRARGLLREGRGSDYDAAFARRHCRGCTYREWTAGIDRRPIEQLYALQRFAAENTDGGYNIDHVLARRGGGVLPFLKARLVDARSPVMVWNILSTLEVMRDTGSYDVPGDVELMRLAEAAAARANPRPGPLSELVGRLRSGGRMRNLPARPMG